MEENMKDNMWTIRSMEQVLSIGRMEGSMLVPGRMVSSMEEDNIIWYQDKRG